jgi:tetratricopeptide (TPR) repeat protein
MEQWVSELGVEDFDTREAASKKLWQAGRAAEAIVAEATKSSDAEVARRARELHDKFRWGIYPDTPEKVVAAIRSYQSGEPAAKQAAIHALLELGGPGGSALLKIVHAEPDADLRRRLFAEVGQEAFRAVPSLLADGSFKTLEDLLEVSVAAHAESALPSYAAYLLRRSRLDDRIAHYKAETAKPDGNAAWEVLAYLYRAKGDLPAARTAAEKAERPELLETILFQMADWKELLRRSASSGRQPVEELGFRAAYERLSGDTAASAKTLDELKKQAAAKVPGDYEVWLIAKALFLNGRPKDALEVLERDPRHSPVRFEVLCAQLRYREAFAFAEGTSGDRSVLALLHARQLYLLGDKEKALGLFKRFGETMPAGEDQSWQQKLIDTEIRLGLDDLAIEHCARRLGTIKGASDGAHVLDAVVGSQGEAAALLWLRLRQVKPGENPVEVLKRLQTAFRGKATLKELTALTEEVEKKEVPATERDTVLCALGIAALASGDEAKGREWLEKSGTKAALLRLGDESAKKKQWEGAAELYARAWSKDFTDPLPLFLRGHALAQGGTPKEGARWKEAAHLLPLGYEKGRLAFASALERRGFHDDSLQECETISAVCAANSPYLGEAMRRVAMYLIDHKEYTKGAEWHERAMLRCLDARVSFAESSAYVLVPSMTQRYRALGLALEGKYDQAKEPIEKAEAALPGGTELPIRLVPILEKGGKSKEAEDLFRRFADRQEKLCKEYPNSALMHNNAAWLAVACRRDLDRALDHAEKAVKLSPDTPAYHDTLGEVLFQRGEKEKALAEAKRSLELDPQRKYFRKQVARIEKGNRDAPLPNESDD